MNTPTRRINCFKLKPMWTTTLVVFALETTNDSLPPLVPGLLGARVSTGGWAVFWRAVTSVSLTTSLNKNMGWKDSPPFVFGTWHEVLIVRAVQRAAHRYCEALQPLNRVTRALFTSPTEIQQIHTRVFWLSLFNCLYRMLTWRYECAGRERWALTAMNNDRTETQNQHKDCILIFQSMAASIRETPSSNPQLPTSPVRVRF